MGITNLKYKNIFALALLIGIFVCGLNFRQWYIANHREKKNISLIYSLSANKSSCMIFEEHIKQEFKNYGIDAVFDRFYLDCNCYDLENGTNNIREHLELIKSKTIGLILVVGDQATNALLSTRHPLLFSTPVVACNVHFPDEKLIKEYERKKVYVLRDTPDFKRNIEFIKSLHPHTGMEIVFNVDVTPLGRQSFDLLTKYADRKNVQVLGQQSAFSLEHEYKAMMDMVQYYNLMPALANNHINKNELMISLCPFRYIKGLSLLVMMEKSGSEQGQKAFLLDKFDVVSLPIVNALNIPSFSCIREGFGGEGKIVGGYMATSEISARSAVELSVRLMNKEKIGMPKIRDLEKEYVLDWSCFSTYKDNDIKRVPRNTRIINYPLYEHYRQELYLLIALFILAFIFITISLLRMRRRSLIERKNMEMLEEAHKRLTLSADGGQISLWNMQGNVIEFDDNYTRLTGLQRRRFSRVTFSRFTHPDDLPSLGTLYETLCQSSDMQIRRMRFCFSGNKDEYQWYELRCRSLKDAKGEMMLAGVIQNIQELVEREHQLILAKQMAEKAELKQSFLNNMSHEIRTPLNAIVGFTNLLTSNDADEIDEEEKANMLEIINHNNDLLLKLINDIVEISHFDSGYTNFEIKRWNITEIIKEVYATYQPLIQPSLQFHLELDESLYLSVNIDRERFIQVISNFLNNANKFTQKGYITLGCKVDRKQNEVCIYVKDSGKGINEKELIMIFDRFYKSDEFEQGSGLGLSISKIIIEKLSGRIEVHSEAGKGSCFSAVLSLASADSDVTDD